MLRRNRFRFQAHGAGFHQEASPFNKHLSSTASSSSGGGSKTPKTTTGHIAGLEHQPGGPYARFPAYAARMMDQQEERLRKSKLIGQGKDPNMISNPDELAPEELSEKFMETRTKKKTPEEEEAEGPGQRDDVDPRVARRMKQGKKYSSGPETVASWYRIFGSNQAIPHPHSSHPDFSISYKDADENDHSVEAEEMRKKTGIMFFKKKPGNKNDNNNNDNTKDAAKSADDDVSAAETKNGTNKKADESLKPDYDPFTAAFTPNAEKRRESVLKARREYEEKMLRQDQNNGNPGANNKKTASNSQDDENDDNRDTSSETSNKTANKTQQQQKQQQEAAAGGDYGFTRNQVGGASVKEWKEKIKRVRARGEGNLTVRLQGEIGFAHVLSQTGMPDDAKECLDVGEYIWEKLDELKKNSPHAEGSTHNVTINVCSAMARSARTLGKGDVAAKWQERLSESDKALRQKMEFYDKTKIKPQSMEPDKKSGVRKHMVSANSMWAGLRNPWFNVAWARKSLGEDPEQGPRYTK